ncbi:MAG: ATP-dependent helicase [Sulfurovum sp.]|nr:MAG: ATP-dependent helicase [Sulfurovum sp.]
MPLSSLNREQYLSATAPLGNNLIIASAGTGKTSTIVGRIGHLLKSGTPPNAILLLTFTNKASAEMISRLGRYFDTSITQKIEAGTFHSVSYRWLKEANSSIMLKQPNELKTLFRSIYEKRHFKRMNIDIEPFSSTYLYEQYNLYQNASNEGFDVWFLERYQEHKPLIDIYMDIIKEYEVTKDRFGFVSFNDLLIKMREYLLKNPKNLTEVLVDEYQDTNNLQSSLIDAINSGSLFCVGDYDQSIYAFNGANIENIASFSSRYKDAKVFTLSKNYRSSASILSLASKVIEINERIYPKKLEVTQLHQNIPPRLFIYDELFEQYQSIARLIAESSTPNDDIAVIFRNNSSADGIEASLRELDIPSKRKGGRSFFEAKEVKFLLDMLTIVVNPKDMMAFIHIFEYAKGLGASVAKEVFESLVHFGNGSLMQGIFNPLTFTLPKLNMTKNVQLGLFDDDFSIGSISRFTHLNLPEKLMAHPLLKHPRISVDGVVFFHHFYNFVHTAKISKHPQSILKKLIESPIYEAILDNLSNQRAKLKSGEIDKAKKEVAKESIIRKAKLLSELSTHYKDLNKFVNAMVLGGGELSQGAGVNLLSVHASKGLEFKEVFVLDLMDGRFPNRKLMSQGGSLEEERRLFYVAVTRAKERLCLSFASYDSVKKAKFMPSNFLFEASMLNPNDYKVEK